jgi:hypothetical protein
MTFAALFQGSAASRDGAFTTTSTMSFAMAILNCSLDLFSAMINALELVLY